MEDAKTVAEKHYQESMIEIEKMIQQLKEDFND